MDIILIVLLVCGQPDTLIIKEPNKTATYSHDVKSLSVLKVLHDTLKTKPIIIEYEDKRGICA